MKIHDINQQIEKVMIFSIILYIIGISIGSATTYVHAYYDHIMVAVICILQLVLFLTSVYVRKRIYSSLRSNKLFQFAVFWLIYGSVMYFFMLDKTDTAFLLYRTLLISVFTISILIINVFDHRTSIYYMGGMLIGMLINYGISLYELITYRHIGIVLGPHMLKSTFVGLSNVNNYASFLLYCVPFMFMFYITKVKKQSYLALLFCIFVFHAYLIYSTGSMTGICGLSIILIIGAIINYVFKKLDVISTQLIVFMSVIFYLFVSLFLLFLVLLDTPDIESERLLLLYNAGIEFLKTYGIGLGPGGSQAINDGWVHNLLMEILYEYGIITFILFFVCWIKLLYSTACNASMKRIRGYIYVFILILPFIWISSSSALSLHFTWINITLLYEYFCDVKSLRIVNNQC